MRSRAAAARSAAAATVAAGDWILFEPNPRPALGGGEALRPSLSRMLPLTSLHFVGQDEADALLETSDPAGIAKTAHGSGAREAVVTGGAAGCWYEQADGMAHLPAAKAEVVDPVGAGDAFAGGYLAARLRGATPAQAARGWKARRRTTRTPSQVHLDDDLPSPERRCWRVRQTASRCSRSSVPCRVKRLSLTDQTRGQPLLTSSTTAASSIPERGSS